MRITSKGQVTIPKAIREQAGLLPHTEVAFSIDGDRVVLEKVEGAVGRGQVLIDHMRGTATMSMTTDEIMRLTRS